MIVSHSSRLLHYSIKMRMAANRITAADLDEQNIDMSMCQVAGCENAECAKHAFYRPNDNSLECMCEPSSSPRLLIHDPGPRILIKEAKNILLVLLMTLDCRKPSMKRSFH